MDEILRGLGDSSEEIEVRMHEKHSQVSVIIL